MRQIKLNTFRADLIDRMDNTVQAQQLSEQLRNKLESDLRVVDAMNQALVLFMHDADAATLQEFQREVSMTPMSTSNVVSTYRWPEDAYEERPDGGLVVLNLDGQDQYYDRFHNYPYQSVRSLANNPFYGPSHKAYHVNLQSKRIYVPKDVQLKCLIISEPGSILSNPDFTELYYGDVSNENEVTDESLTATHDSYVDMTNENIVHSSVRVFGSSDELYKEGLDYVVDYTSGKLKALSSGNIGDSDSLTIDYKYYSNVTSYLPISQTFRQTLSQLALQELIKMGQNAPNRQDVISDTATTQQNLNRPASQQAQEGEE